MSYYDEYTVIPTRTLVSENYETLGQLSRPRYMGGIGDPCDNGMQCHQRLSCIRNYAGTGAVGTCGNWGPPDNYNNFPYTNTNSNSVGNNQTHTSVKEGFYATVPNVSTDITPKQAVYTSKYMPRNGSNHYVNN